MKITFKSIGAIKETELDLRPMTVIIGPNNSNKTYIAYLIYGLWKEQIEKASMSTYTLLLNDKKGNFFEIVSKDEKSKSYELKINWAFFESWIGLLAKNTERFQKKLSNYFQDTNNQIFKDSKIIIDIDISEFRDRVRQFCKKSPKIEISNNAFFEYKFENDCLHGKITLDKSSDDENSDEFNKVLEKVFSDEWKMFAFGNVLDNKFALNSKFTEEIVRAFFPTPFLLPAERNAFVITYKILESRRYRLLREVKRSVRLETVDIRYPVPIEDFLDFLTDVELQNEPINKSEERIPFLKLADEIEKYIQNKNKTQLKATKMGGKELKVSVKKDLNIDLYNASSSIKQLAPLLLYLRYRAKKNDLLIIDEPEMNLHPESQVKLLEALAILTNLGVNVLLTTHSPYFMSHLNTLVAGNKENPKVLKKQAKSLYMQNENAFLRLEDVSAYEMKDNQLVSLKDEEYGIRWDTLSDVSVDVQQKYFEIFESGDTSHNGK